MTRQFPPTIALMALKMSFPILFGWSGAAILMYQLLIPFYSDHFGRFLFAEIHPACLTFDGQGATINYMAQEWNSATLASLEVPEDLPVTDETQLQDVLSRISFDHSVIDFAWTFKYRPAAFPPTLDQQTNAQTASAVEGWLVWAEFIRPDIQPPHTVGVGRGRDEIIIKGMMTSGVVKTCWVLVELLVKHELMEGFRFDGIQIFNPHMSVFELMIAAKRRQAMAMQPPPVDDNLSFLRQNEREAVKVLAEKKEMSAHGVIRMALRLFQAVDGGAAELKWKDHLSKVAELPMSGCSSGE